MVSAASINYENKIVLAKQTMRIGIIIQIQLKVSENFSFLAIIAKRHALLDFLDKFIAKKTLVNVNVVHLSDTICF